MAGSYRTTAGRATFRHEDEPRSPTLTRSGAGGVTRGGGTALNEITAAPGTRRHTAISRALVDIARGEVPVLGPEVHTDPSSFVEAARYHRLAPLAHTMLRDSEPAVAEPLRIDRDAAVSLHLHITTLVGHVGELLAGVPWAVFKGPVLSELAHPVPGLRPYRDLDVLVAPSELREVSRRLLAAGWAVADFEDMLRNPATPGEMHWRSPSGALMDLHWSMINMAERRRQLAVPTQDLLERRVAVTLGFSSGWMLDPTDAFIHVCLHGALTGANKLLYLVDAQRMAAHVPDWAVAGRRAADWKAAPHVSLVLRRAQAALGGSVPEDVDRLLGTSPAFRALTAAVDRVAPVAHARTEPGIARLVARAVRPGAARTALATSRSVLRYLSGRRRPRFPADRHPADEHALEVYLERVESAAGAVRGDPRPAG